MRSDAKGVKGPKENGRHKEVGVAATQRARVAAERPAVGVGLSFGGCDVPAGMITIPTKHLQHMLLTAKIALTHGPRFVL
jgi:hypothetical protein